MEVGMVKTEDELLRAVARAYDRAQRAQAGCCGTTATQCQILCAIGSGGPVPQAELGARLGLEKSWVSRAIDGLEREGLAERRKCCQDARMYDVALTESGERRFRDLNAALNDQAEAVMSRIPEAERAGVRRSLELLAEALSSMEAECRCGGSEPGTAAASATGPAAPATGGSE